jgi:hypothetical protein
MLTPSLVLTFSVRYSANRFAIEFEKSTPMGVDHANDICCAANPLELATLRADRL